MASVRINAARLWDRLMALGSAGATGRGGVDRQALTEAEAAARRLVISWAGEHELQPSMDAAGNLFLTLAGSDPSLVPVMTGSHLDSQPSGGLFDGAFGVIAGLEVAAALVEADIRPQRSLVVVAWMNEEGCRFVPGMMGSEAFVGLRSLEEIRAVSDAGGITVGTELDRLHAAFPDLARVPVGFPIHFYVEAHIEQGPSLEANDCPIGIVTSIQGKRTFTVSLHGAEAHAGTAPMAERRDAVAALARVLVALHARIGGADSDVKFTAGRVRVVPNAPSVVPGSATFSVDLRHFDEATMLRLADELEAISVAEASPCTVEIQALVNNSPIEFDPVVQDAVGRAATRCGYRATRLPSLAGHDAGPLARRHRAGMIFIPCRDGVSHAETEWAEPAHTFAGAEVLLWTLTDLLQ